MTLKRKCLAAVYLVFATSFFGCTSNESVPSATSTTVAEATIENDLPASEDTTGSYTTSSVITSTINTTSTVQSSSRTPKDSLYAILNTINSPESTEAFNMWFCTAGQGTPTTDILGIQNNRITLRSRHNGETFIIENSVKSYDLLNNGVATLEIQTRHLGEVIRSGLNSGQEVTSHTLVRMIFDTTNGTHSVYSVDSMTNVEGLPNYMFYKKDQFDSPRVIFFEKLLDDIQRNNKTTLAQYALLADRIRQTPQPQ